MEAIQLKLLYEEKEFLKEIFETGFIRIDSEPFL